MLKCSNIQLTHSRLKESCSILDRRHVGVLSSISKQYQVLVWTVLTVDVEQSFRTERRAYMPGEQRRFARIHSVDVCQAVQMIGPSFLRVEWFCCIVIFMAMKQKFVAMKRAFLLACASWTLWDNAGRKWTMDNFAAGCLLYRYIVERFLFITYTSTQFFNVFNRCSNYSFDSLFNIPTMRSSLNLNHFSWFRPWERSNNEVNLGWFLLFSKTLEKYHIFNFSW